MPRFALLGLAALGAMTLVGCSSDARSTDVSPTATPRPAGSDRPEPAFRPSSAARAATRTPEPPSRRATSTPEPSDRRPTPALRATLTSPPAPDIVRHLPTERELPVAYVALGDSTVEGIGATSPEKNYVGRIFARLKDQYPAAKVENLGVAGATSADVALRQLPKAVALRPTLVTLSVGPNDITQGRDIEEYEHNVDTILGTLARDTEAVVVVNTLPDMAVSPIFTPEERQLVGALARAYSDVLARKAREHGAEVVELYAPSQEEVPANQSLFSADNYHPSDAGYARWADLMWRGVEARIEGQG